MYNYIYTSICMEIIGNCLVNDPFSVNEFFCYRSSCIIRKYPPSDSHVKLRSQWSVGFPENPGKASIDISSRFSMSQYDSVWQHGSQSFAGWWFGCHQFYFPRNIGNNHPNWLIFFRGVAQPPTRFVSVFRFGWCLISTIHFLGSSILKSTGWSAWYKKLKPHDPMLGTA